MVIVLFFEGKKVIHRSATISRSISASNKGQKFWQGLGKKELLRKWRRCNLAQESFRVSLQSMGMPTNQSMPVRPSCLLKAKLLLNLHNKVFHLSEFWKHLRVVILNPPLPRFFYVFFYCSTGSKPMNAPLFLETQYFERVSKIYSFFPWRSPSLTYYPLNECEYRKIPLFWKMEGFWGKGRTPGERWPKCLQWTHWCSPKPLDL